MYKEQNLGSTLWYNNNRESPTQSFTIYTTSMQLCVGRLVSDALFFRVQDYSEAVKWYQRTLECTNNPSDSDGDSVFGSEIAPADPDHAILSRMAELYRGGGLGLEKDPQKSGDLYSEAAEAAMNAMKGKLANKFYMLAEEAWAEVPDEEEEGEED